jgi:hypothetical protein
MRDLEIPFILALSNSSRHGTVKTKVTKLRFPDAFLATLCATSRARRLQKKHQGNEVL